MFVCVRKETQQNSEREKETERESAHARERARESARESSVKDRRQRERGRERESERGRERERMGERERASERASESEREKELRIETCAYREREGTRDCECETKRQRYTPAPGGACSTRLGRSSSKAISSGSSGVMGKSADAPIWNAPCTRRSRGQCVERCRGNPSLGLRQCCTAGGDGRSTCITSRVGRSIWLEKGFRCERSLRTKAAALSLGLPRELISAYHREFITYGRTHSKWEQTQKVCLCSTHGAELCYIVNIFCVVIAKEPRSPLQAYIYFYANELFVCKEFALVLFLTPRMNRLIAIVVVIAHEDQSR